MESNYSSLKTKINPSDVYKGLETRKFVEKIYNEIVNDVKNSSAYVKLKGIALHHFTSFETGENDPQCTSPPIETKKKLVYDVGYLSDCIASTLNKAVHETLLAYQDDIYAASQSVIEELEEKNSEHETRCPNDDHSKLNGTHMRVSPSNKKRRIESNSDACTSPSKRLSNRLKKPNSRYYAEDILTSMTDNCFGDASKKT